MGKRGRKTLPKKCFDEVYEKIYRKQIPIKKVMDEYGLDDPDFIYDIIYGREKHTMAGFSMEQQEHSFNIEANAKYNHDYLIKNSIEKIASINERVRILEVGSGAGKLAFEIAKSFSNTIVDGIDLSKTAIEESKKRWDNMNSRLNFFIGAAGQGISKNKYDVVFHINVLEHIPNQIEYFQKEYNALKEKGHIIFVCPTLGYWIFWGFPKFLICKITNREFMYHGFSEFKISKFVRQNKAKIIKRHFYCFIPPRRIFKYFPPKFIVLFGKCLNIIEKILPEQCFLFMYQFWHIQKTDEGTLSNSIKPKDILKQFSKILLLLLTFPLVLLIWVGSSFFMTLEFVRGRKTFFYQG